MLRETKHDRLTGHQQLGGYPVWHCSAPQSITHHSCSRPGRRDTQVTLVAAETLLSLSALNSSRSDFRAMPFDKLPSGF